MFSRTSPSPFLCRYIGLSGKGEEVSGHVPQDAESRGRGRGGQERPSRGRVSLCPIKQHGRRAISVYPHADAHDASRVTWGGGSSSCWCGDGGAGVCTPERRSSCRSHPGSRGSKWATRDVSRHHVCPSFPSSRFFSTTSVSEVEGEGGTRLHHLHEGAGGGGGGGLKKNATTLKVWKPHAEALRRALKQAEFVALDVELTGDCTPRCDSRERRGGSTVPSYLLLIFSFLSSSRVSSPPSSLIGTPRHFPDARNVVTVDWGHFPIARESLSAVHGSLALHMQTQIQPHVLPNGLHM